MSAFINSGHSIRSNIAILNVSFRPQADLCKGPLGNLGSTRSYRYRRRDFFFVVAFFFVAFFFGLAVVGGASYLNDSLTFAR